MIFNLILMLFKDDILYILHCDPIYLEIYSVKDIMFCMAFPSERLYVLTPIIGHESDKHIWLENTLNLNKLIKQKIRLGVFCEKNKTRFISCNEKLILKKLNILIKYSPKHKQLNNLDND